MTLRCVMGGMLVALLVARPAGAELVGHPMTANAKFPCRFSTVTLVVTVTNTGANAATAVTPPGDLFVEGVADRIGVAPSPVTTLAPGAAATFTWRYRNKISGSLMFTATITGSDAVLGVPLSTGPCVSNLITVLPSGLLETAASASPFTLAGRWFTVTMTASNTGDDNVTGVVPAITAVSGGGSATLMTGPVPSAPLTIPPGGATLFTWTFSATGAGPVAFTVTATGTTCVGIVTTSSATVHTTILMPAAGSTVIAPSGTVPPIEVGTEALPRGLLIAPNRLDLADPSARIRVLVRGDPGGTVRLRIFDEHGGSAGTIEIGLDARGRGEVPIRLGDPPGLSFSQGVHWVVATGGGLNARKPLVVVRKRR